MNDIEKLLYELEPEQLSELLEDIDVPEDMLLAQRIKDKTLGEIINEDEALPVRRKKRISFIKLIPAAAAFVIIAAGAVFALSQTDFLDKQEQTTEATTAESTTRKNYSWAENPLMLAVSGGNESLIETLLTNTLLISEEVLSLAIDCADILSYGIIQEIALACKDTFGTTGLDALLESTLLGDSAAALKELKARENMLMTPLEKLSFFFSAAFCDSEVIGEFISRGFGVEMTNEAGQNVYEVAEKYGNEKSVESAERNG